MIYCIAFSFLLAMGMWLRWRLTRPANLLYDCYTINKGSNYSYVNHDPLEVKLKFSPTLKSELRFNAIFGLGCNYDLGNSDQADVNKLYGLQFGWSSQRASARVGWRYVPSTKVEGRRGLIELLLYVHDGRERIILPIANVALGEGFSCSLFISGQSQVLAFFDCNTASIFKNYQLEHVKPWRLKFRLFPYFGGNQVAPKLMKIFIKER